MENRPRLRSAGDRRPLPVRTGSPHAGSRTGRAAPRRAALRCAALPCPRSRPLPRGGAGGGARRDGPYEGSAGRCHPPARPLTRRRSAAQHGSAMAASAEEAAGSGGSPSSARRRLRIISGHLRGSPRAPGREALSPSPCKAQGGSAAPASGSIPKKRWVRAGVPAAQRAPGCGGGSVPGWAGSRSGRLPVRVCAGQPELRIAVSLPPGAGVGWRGRGRPRGGCGAGSGRAQTRVEC